MREVGRRLQAFVREAGPREALIGAVVLLALSLLALSLSVVWYGVLSSRQAAEQAIREEEAPAPQEPRPEDFPLIFEPGSSLAEVISAAARRRVIPGLSEMDVIGYLPHLPGTNFRCVGPTTDQGLDKRVCTSSSGEGSPVYEVTLLEDGPLRVVAVQATARNTSDEKAADFLAYVAGLSLKDAAPSLDARSWVSRNIKSGGQYFADGAEVRLYGTPGDRTLEVVATGLPAERIPRTPETTTDRGITVPTIDRGTTAPAIEITTPSADERPRDRDRGGLFSGGALSPKP